MYIFNYIKLKLLQSQQKNTFKIYIKYCIKIVISKILSRHSYSNWCKTIMCEESFNVINQRVLNMQYAFVIFYTINITLRDLFESPQN